MRGEQHLHLGAGELGGDVYALIDTPLIVPVRCSTPDRGELIEAHLNLLINVIAATDIYVGVGQFDTDGITAKPVYAPSEVIAMHKRLTGSEAPISSSSGVLFIDGMNVFPLIPKQGDAAFNQDGFVLLFLFNRSRNNLVGNDTIKRFEVVCSAQMGLV